MKLWIDFETYCDLDIKKVGLYKYIYHPSFHVWCCGYAFNNDPIDIVLQNDIPVIAKEIYLDKNTLIYAHNAEFEYHIFKRIGYSIPLLRFVDVMALAGTYGYPLQLDKFVKALGLPYGKDAKGTRLINKLCKPQKKTIRNPSGRIYPKDDPKAFQELYQYCKQDVKIMREAVALLPSDRLTSQEQYVWGHTIVQNERGVKIDKKSVINIVDNLNQNKVNMERQLIKLTNGVVQTGKQIAKIQDFLQENGLRIPNLQKNTIEMYLQAENIKIPHVCREVLKLRQQLAHSSVAKFEKMLYMIQEDNRIRGNVAYHVAHTGRWGGRGIQAHNLPRAQHKKPEKVLRIFNSEKHDVIKYHYPDLNAAASKLVRPVLIADDEMKLCVADYRSIENVILHWCAGDEETTQDFRNGLCQYKVYSSRRLNKSYDDITKEERQQSKPDVLGLGYGGGANALIGVAAGYGVNLSHREAEARVKYYRKHYHLIPKFWRKIYNAAKKCILTNDTNYAIMPEVEFMFEYKNGNLWIHLPSGRSLFYREIEVDAVWYTRVPTSPGSFKTKTIPMTAEISYMGIRNNQWVRIGTHPGMLVENIVQALARDCLAYGLLCVEQAGYPVILSVHDEIVCETPDTSEYSVKQMCDIMCTKQKWNKTLPLFADGWEGYRYKKD